MCRGYHFWNQAVNTPISAGRMELIAPTKLAASVCMMKHVQMGVIKYSTPHAAVRMRFVLMKITDNGNRAIDEGYRRKCA